MVRSVVIVEKDELRISENVLGLESCWLWYATYVVVLVYYEGCKIVEV